MRYLDIHSHLNLSPLREDQGTVLARMHAAETGTITVGVDYETSVEAVRLAQENPNIWATIGLHPTDNDKEEFDYEKYLDLARKPAVVAIGECGLDYFRDAQPETKERQKNLFLKHIQLAMEIKKPLMIHCRPSKGSMDAYEDAITILKNSRLRGNFHFFAGDILIAKKILDLGFTMSFDGPITFSHDYDEVIKFLPIESIMTETDAPFAAPVPYRGKTNEPAYVVEIAKKIAEIKNLSEEETRKILLNNAKALFGLDFDIE